MEKCFGGNEGNKGINSCETDEYVVNVKTQCEWEGIVQGGLNVEIAEAWKHCKVYWHFEELRPQIFIYHSGIL